MPDTTSITSPIESLLVGKVRCDYIRPSDFVDLCAQWIKGGTFKHVVTLNPEMVMQAEKYPDFTEALAKADIRVPDGAGLIWARWFLRSNFWSLWPSLFAFPFIESERVTGVDSIMEIARLCEQTQQVIFLLGGTEWQANKTAALLRRKFPRLEVKSLGGHVYDIDGPADIIKSINEAQPAALLVAYGSPKQTLWIERHRRDLPSVKIAIGVGGAFAILSEQRRRAPHWIRRMNAEWLWRLWLEPTRFQRIFKATVSFPILVASQKKMREDWPNRDLS